MDPKVALPCEDGAGPRSLASRSLSTMVIVDVGNGGVELTVSIIVVDDGDGGHCRLQWRSIAAGLCQRWSTSTEVAVGWS